LRVSDRAVVAMAFAAAAGARLAFGVPTVLALVVVAVAVAGRWSWLLVIGAALLTSGLAARAWSGLLPPSPAPVEDHVTLVDDPEEFDGALRVEVRVGRRRAEAWARGAPAAMLRPRLSGEQVEIRGALTPVPERARSRLARRHVAARLTIHEVRDWRAGGFASRAANGLRRTLVAGAESLDQERRSLFAGLVLGDRRGQPPEVEDDFRAAGLTHLLAVSGQNVAFVLALVRPLLARLGLRARLGATVAMLSFFALVTRWEPSVLRACAMAGVAATAFTVGRPSSRARVLALAVTGVLVLDPLLVGSVAFLLSVGASAGIVWFAGPIAARVRGPRILVEPLAVTVAAQLGVAPVLIPVFGGMPVAALPANLLAGPAAGPVMMWGMTGGLVAGVAPPSVSRLLHLPTQILVGWIAGVARVAASLPLGELGAVHAVAIGAALGFVLLARRLRWQSVVPVGLIVCVLPLLAASGAPVGAVNGLELTPSATLWRAEDPRDHRVGVVLVIAEPDTSRLLAGLRRYGVRRIDVLVVTRGSSAGVADTVMAVRRRISVRIVLAPASHRLRDARTPPVGVPIVVGGLRLRAEAVEPELSIEVRRVGSPP